MATKRIVLTQERVFCACTCTFTCATWDKMATFSIIGEASVSRLPAGRHINMILQRRNTSLMGTKLMINMLQGFDKGQFGKKMHRFETITDGSLAPTCRIRVAMDTCLVGNCNSWCTWQHLKRNHYSSLFTLRHSRNLTGYRRGSNVQADVQTTAINARRWACTTTWQSANMTQSN